MFAVADDGPKLPVDGYVANSLIKTRGHNKPWIAAYNDFMKRCLTLLVEKKYTFHCEYQNKIRSWYFSFEKPEFETGNYYPIHCMEKGLTYGMDLKTTAIIATDDKKEITIDINMGKFPIMLGSDYDKLKDASDETILKYGEDPDFPGSSFCIDGRLFQFVPPENLGVNSVLVYTEVDKSQKEHLVSTITTESPHGKTGVISMFLAKGNICRFDSFRDFFDKRKSEANLNVLSVFKIFDYDKEFFGDLEEFILSFTRPEWKNKVKMLLSPTINDYNKLTDDRLMAAIKKVVDNASKTIELSVYRMQMSENLYTHIPKTDIKSKLVLVCYQLVRILEVALKLREPDDRNSYSRKRFKNAGSAMYHLFVWYMEEKMKDVAQKYNPYMDTSPASVISLFAESNMTINYSHAFKKNWKLKTARGNKKANYSEPLKTDQFMLTHFHVDKIVKARDAHTKSYKVRGVHGTQAGIMCPGETPESEKCGLNNSKAQLGSISRPHDDDMIIDALMQLEDEKNRNLVNLGRFIRKKRMDSFIVVNGRVLGICMGRKCQETLREMRRNKDVIPEDCDIFFDKEEKYLYLQTDAGRPTQLMYSVNTKTGLLRLEEEGLEEETDGNVLFDAGCIEYVSAREKEYSVVAESREQMKARREEVAKAEERLERLINLRDNYDNNKIYVRSLVDPDQIVEKNVLDKEIIKKQTSLRAIYDKLAVKYKQLVVEMEELIENEDNVNFIDRYNAIDGELKRLEKDIDFYDPNQYNLKERTHKKSIKDQEEVITLEKLEKVIERATIQLNRLKEHSKFDYCEIDPSLVYGVALSLMTFATMNPGPRQVFSCKMIKQAEGNNNVSSRWKFGANKCTILPARPIARTQTESVLGLNRHPIGYPVIIGIATSDGKTIEDATEVRKGFFERNAFASIDIKEIRETFDRPGEIYLRDKKIVVSTHFGNDIPDKIRSRHNPDAFRNLDADGFIKVGSVLKIGDCVLGCYKMRRKENVIEYVDMGIYVKRSRVGTVTKRLVYNQETIKGTLVVEIAQFKIPEVGDKFSSTEAQKGVIGSIIADADAAVVVDPPGVLHSPMAGVSPDFFMNPHAYPSRMTIGMFIEEILSLYGVLTGNFIDATAFRDPSLTLEQANKYLTSRGLPPFSEQYVYNPRTGKVLKSLIFVGICQYLRLVHEASSKVQNRYVGSYISKTKQPVTGMDFGGGQRLGEMEIEALITHGASYTTSTALGRDSDHHIIKTCSNCNSLIYKVAGGKYVCKNCKIPAKILFAPSTHVMEMLREYLLVAGIELTYKLTPELSDI